MSNFNDDISWDDDSEEETTENMVAPPPTFGPPPVVGANTDNYGEPVSFNEIDTINNPNTESSNPIVSVASTGEGEHMTVIQIGRDGEEISTVIDMALPPLDEEEARNITEKIKGTTNLLYLLIKRAHAGKAYKALGYSSFEAYVRAEFNYSRSYAYKLLNQATVIEAIEAVAPEGTEVYVGELTSRGLKASLPELLEDIEERTADATPEEAKHLIEEAIRDVQNKKEEEYSFDEDYDDNFNPEDTFSGSGSSPVDFIDEEDDSLNEFLGGEDPTLVVQRLEGLWNLVNGLQNFADLHESGKLSELLPLIPQDRIEEITGLISVNVAWLEELRTAWDEFLLNPTTGEENTNSTDENDDSEENFDNGDIEF